MPPDNIQGVRADTLELLKDYEATVYRRPGGTFVNNHRWRDATGDPHKRPPRLNTVYWSEIVEPMDFAPDEFMTLMELLDAKAYIAISVMTLTDAQMAAAEVECFSGAAGTPMGQLRAANGHPEPYGVRFWGIGNEPSAYASLSDPLNVHDQIAAAQGKTTFQTYVRVYELGP